VVTLLERQGIERGVGGLAGSLILFAGHGHAAGRRPARAAGAPTARSGSSPSASWPRPRRRAARRHRPARPERAGSAVLGLAVGVPFAAVMGAAQRLRPDAPAAAIGLVNGVAVLTILVGTPLAGLAFELPATAASPSPSSRR
jgi:hypothetical protein